MMGITSRLRELQILKDNPFAKDVLDREKYANILTQDVEAYSKSGCVLALNGKWGTGKTTFVKMWKQHLLNNGYNALYFNAWSQDYVEDPLIALISELEDLNGRADSKKKYKNIVAATGRIILSTTVAVGSSLLRNVTGLDGNVISSAIDATAEKAKEIADEYLKDYAAQKVAFQQFKECLQEFVNENAVDKPIIFFVDELDRCRPDFAVKVLERIKHLFDVENIVFVLSINKEQLANAIQGFYGTPKTDSSDYLRRFIDLEYDMPAPNVENFITYLYNEYNFDDFSKSEGRLKFFGREREDEQFKNTAIKIAKICNIDLRTLDRIFSISRIAIQSCDSNTYVLPDVFFVLCVLKVIYKEVYSNIEKKTYSIQSLINELENTIFSKYTSISDMPYTTTIEWTLGELIVQYNMDNRLEAVDKTFKGEPVDGTNKCVYPISTTKFKKDRIDEAVDWLYLHMHGRYALPLNVMIDRINLLNAIK